MTRRYLLRLVAPASLVAPAALAQQKDPGLFRGPKKEKDDPTRSVAGLVRSDNDAPVEGAVVQLKDTKSLKVRSFLTRADGSYQFHGLSANVDYELKAGFQGASSEPKTLSVFDSRKQAVINLKLQARKSGS